MYISRSELNQLLKKPYFQTFFNKSIAKFALYRGHFNAHVLTLRYSVLSPEYNENFMITNVIQEVLNHFPPTQKSVRGLIEYDIILRAKPMEDEEQESFYFWRANSNRSNVPNNETVLTLDHDSLFLFIRNAARINPAELDVYFANSNVAVFQIVSIIFTFITV